MMDLSNNKNVGLLSYLLGKDKDELNSQNCPEGGINGLFSISPTEKVYFSKGNLQYQVATGLWRFAEKQYDRVAYTYESEKKFPDDYDWIDLFGWGTGDHPQNASKTTEDYAVFVDWGRNPVSNGGNTADLWRTLTPEEWAYLFMKRHTHSGWRFTKANVCGENGVILFPDHWGKNEGFYYVNNRKASFDDTSVSEKDWPSLEQQGVVFLPAAGCREQPLEHSFSVGSFWGMGLKGAYWSSQEDGEWGARHLCFYEGRDYLNSLRVGFDPDSYCSRDSGCSVCLVCPIENLK